MRIRGRQETSAAPNKLLLNGKVLLTKSLCNGNNHHPPQLSQYGFPFHILPHLADGFPIPILPNLNSFPEITTSTVLSEAVCSPPTPVTLDKNKRIQDLRGYFSQEVIDLVDGTIQGKQTEVLRPAGKEPTGLFFSQPAGKEPTGLFFSQPAGKEPTGLFFSKPVISELISFQQKEGETNVAISSEGVLLQQQETEEHGKREDQGIDLNKTPQQKPRRKKHRPKVIREGKPARTPKPVTPKPVTPKPARNKESPSGKRKYVRKNKVVNSDNPLSPLSEIVDADSRSGTKSVRRCLNFESEEPQARNGCLGSPSRFSDNREAQAKDVCISGVITSSIFKSAVPSAQGGAMAENTSAGVTFDINSSMKQTSNAVIGIPHTPTQASQPSRRDTRINDVMNEFIRVANYSAPPPQTSRREIIQENLKKFAWNNEYRRIAGNSDRSTETGQKSQLDPNNSSDVLLRGTKRGHNLVDDEHILTFKNFMHANNMFDHISESHDTIVHGPFFPEVHKKMRVGEQNEVRSNASSLTTGPSSGWKASQVMPNNGQESTSSDAQKTVASSSKTRLVVPNNCKVFRFSDAQRLMALEKLRASQHMLSVGQRKINPDNTSNVQVRADNLTSLCVTKDCNNMSTPVKPSFFNSTDCHHLSTPKMVRRCNDSQGSGICEPQTSIEALSVNNNVKLKSKKCTEKEQIRLVKPMPLNTNRMRLQEHDVASSSYGSSVVQKFVQISASASGNSKDGNSRLRVSSLQECQNSSNFKESLRGISPSVAVVPYGDPVDDVVRKLKCLNINAGHEIIAVEPQKALVPYGGGSGMVVPYEGPFDLTRKRRPRPKVDLDPETNRVWKLLMGKEGSNEGIDMNKEKWWEEERRIFRGRVDSFIARMHLVQGDRRFSRWKGSVVDSVVGVFLTQNVSDHLSSSAYMALAARFPLRPKGDSSKPNAEKMSSFTEQQDGCIIDLDDSIKWQEKMLGRELCSRGSLVISEAEQIAEKEIANSDQLLGSNTGGSKVNYSKAGGLDFHGELEIGHESAVSRTGTPDTMTSSDRRSMEDVVSSQSSVVSSQNSSEFLVQMADQVKLSSLPYFHAEDMLNGAICNGLDSSSSFMELLQLAESTKFQELYSHGNERVLSTENSGAVDQLARLEVDKRTPIADRSDYLNGKCSPMYRPNPHPQSTQYGFASVSCAPSPSYHLYSSLNSTLVGMGNVNAVREGSIHLPSTASGMNITSNIKIMNGRCGPSTENPAQVMGRHNYSGPSFPSYNLHNSSNPRSVTLGNSNAVRERSSSHLPSTASVMNSTNNIKLTGRKCGPSAEKSTEAMGQHGFTGVPSAPSSSYHIPSFSSSSWTTMGDVTAEREESSSHLPSTNSGMNKTDNIKMIGRRCGSSSENSTEEQKERGAEFQVKSNEHSVGEKDRIQNGKVYQTSLNSHETLKGTSEVVQAVESNLKDEAYSSQKVVAATANSPLKAKRVKAENEKNKTYEWDNLRKQACPNGVKKERSSDALDSLDWEAIRCADVNEISQTIRERGMNNLLAERIKDFLNRLVRDHGSIDLEWLRDVPPDAAKDYLLSIRGLGLKSVECVRLLTLHHLAFPVDTNVGRICVRLGWVPLQPLPESLQIHLLEMYPILETIQKYLWPRLCKLDQRTLYELHYQLITFGKVFCTKSKPNCNACPMRGECKHFASAFASSRLALPGPEEKGLVNSAVPIASKTVQTPILNPFPLPQLEGSTLSCEGAIINNCEPIIEEPATPEPEFVETTEREIEDAFYEDPDEIPHIELNLEEFSQNLQNYMQENNMDLQDGDMSKALVAVTPEAASIPMPKLKNVSHLRTEHQVYELRDSHPLLEGMDQREPDDPSPYLLAIWSPGETAQSTEPPKVCCDSQDNGKLCDKNTCFACNSVREMQSQTVRGTILIPCRTAMRGSFPLNGTYFQVNEVFADHDSSCTPIHVPREWIWNLPRRTVYFGTSIPTIFKGLTTEGIQHCFWRGFVCVRGFDRTTRAPRPLYARLHFPASKVTRNKTKAAASAAAREEE